MGLSTRERQDRVWQKATVLKRKHEKLRKINGIFAKEILKMLNVPKTHLLSVEATLAEYQNKILDEYDM